MDKGREPQAIWASVELLHLARCSSDAKKTLKSIVTYA